MKMLPSEIPQKPCLTRKNYLYFSILKYERGKGKKRLKKLYFFGDVCNTPNRNKEQKEVNNGRKNLHEKDRSWTRKW